MKNFFKFEQTGVTTLVSVIIYITVAAMVGEYIISREVPVAIQLSAITVMLFYTIWQILYVATFISDLFNLFSYGTGAEREKLMETVFLIINDHTASP